MNLIFIILILIILLIYFFYIIFNRSKKSKYLKAGKKWDDIVKELSERK